uniref:Uncharacterized protein n=1 Tax=viral metagenome TaxID=1070528 RepID=A0A6M3JSG5_9ZZZZ
MAYQAPGMTVAELRTLIGNATGKDPNIGAEALQIDQAISAAGQAACLWDGRDWWFLWGTGTFPTVLSTASYALRTVNASAMADMHAPRRVWEGTTRLGQISYQQYLDSQRVLSTGTTGQPQSYAIGADLTMYLFYTPDGTYTITVDYIKRHGKIDGNSSLPTDLIIPADFHYGVYVMGAIWLLKHGVLDPMALRGCPEFVETIHRMQAAAPTEYDDSYGGSEPGVPLPPDKHVIIIGNVL